MDPKDEGLYEAVCELVVILTAASKTAQRRKHYQLAAHMTAGAQSLAWHARELENPAAARQEAADKAHAAFPGQDPLPF